MKKRRNEKDCLKGIKKALSNLTPGVALSGGVALMALGKAIKKSLNK